MFNLADKDSLETNICTVFGATRKRLGLSQSEIAMQLCLPKTAITKIEHGKQTLHASEWFAFCKLTGIDPRSAMSGYTESVSAVELKGPSKNDPFKIPKRFAFDRGSKVRICLPYINQFKKVAGEHVWKDFLKTYKIDSDLFVHLDNQLNLRFNLDLLEAMTHFGLNRDSVNKMSPQFSNPHMHGPFIGEYASKEEELETVSSVVTRMNHYECNHEYTIQDYGSRKFIDIGIGFRVHTANISKSYEYSVRALICEFKRRAIQDVVWLGSSRGRVSVTELDCFFKNGKRCIFRASV